LKLQKCLSPCWPARYKGACGGRGSGKSHFFAGSVVEYCLLNPGAKIVCIREIQKTLAQSAKAVIEQKIQDFGVGSQFRVLYVGSRRLAEA
jgi:phage terminase large subunit